MCSGTYPYCIFAGPLWQPVYLLISGKSPLYQELWSDSRWRRKKSAMWESLTMLALTIINPCCGAFRQASTSPFFRVQQFFLLPLSDKGNKEYLATLYKWEHGLLKEGGLLSPPQSHLKVNSLSSGFTPYSVLYLTSLDGSLDRTEVTDMGLQLPQTLTMLQQVSSGVSDHQRNGRLIRALLPETAARKNRLHMTGTQDCSYPTCSLQLLNLPTQAVLHMILLSPSLVQTLFQPSILFTHHITSFTGATELITRP